MVYSGKGINLAQAQTPFHIQDMKEAVVRTKEDAAGCGAWHGAASDGVPGSHAPVRGTFSGVQDMCNAIVPSDDDVVARADTWVGRQG